jgi:hypothetical protein
MCFHLSPYPHPFEGDHGADDHTVQVDLLDPLPVLVVEYPRIVTQRLSNINCKRLRNSFSAGILSDSGAA